MPPAPAPAPPVAHAAPPAAPAAPAAPAHVAIRPAAHEQRSTEEHAVHHASGPPGYITLDSAPVYASIYVDGKSLGDTPLVHIALSPGRHVVRAVSPSGTAKTVSITIEAGKTAPARRIEW
jgi:serine/threonine-protein kinase